MLILLEKRKKNVDIFKNVCQREKKERIWDLLWARKLKGCLNRFYVQ